MEPIKEERYQEIISELRREITRLRKVMETLYKENKELRVKRYTFDNKDYLVNK
jgi:hypothetical protein